MKSILLIEDNADVLENLKEYLELEGYQILSTNNEKRAMELAMEFIPDLIICDMPKPGIDGYKVLKLIINTSQTAEIPFIFCTTACKSINKTDALKLGADDYIVKPFELKTILNMTKACIHAGSKRLKILC